MTASSHSPRRPESLQSSTRPAWSSRRRRKVVVHPRRSRLQPRAAGGPRTQPPCTGSPPEPSNLSYPPANRPPSLQPEPFPPALVSSELRAAAPHWGRHFPHTSSQHHGFHLMKRKLRGCMTCPGSHRHWESRREPPVPGHSGPSLPNGSRRGRNRQLPVR